MQLSFSPIGTIHSPFKQKFAIPRQPGLVKEAQGLLELLPPYDHPDTLAGIEDFSHLWIIFVFHQTMNKGWSNQVRPPRLGGNRKKGVFATRSTFRPNPAGLSVVEFMGLIKEKNKLYLKLGGIDLLDGTPVIDIKPYLPYSDSIPDATAGFANKMPDTSMQVEFTKQAEDFCFSIREQYPQIKPFIISLLKQDPRPAYKKQKKTVQEYAMSLYNFNIRWTTENNICSVFSISPD